MKFSVTFQSTCPDGDSAVQAPHDRIRASAMPSGLDFLDLALEAGSTTAVEDMPDTTYYDECDPTVALSLSQARRAGGYDRATERVVSVPPCSLWDYMAPRVDLENPPEKGGIFLYELQCDELIEAWHAAGAPAAWNPAAQ